MDYAVCLVVGLSAVSVIKNLCSRASSTISEDGGFGDKVKGTVFFFVFNFLYASIYRPVSPLLLRYSIDQTFAIWPIEANVSQNTWSANDVLDTLKKCKGGRERSGRKEISVFELMQDAGCESGDAVGDRAHWTSMRTRVQVPSTQRAALTKVLRQAEIW